MPLPSVPFTPSSQLAPVYGTLKVAVIASEFSDVNHTRSIADIKQDYTGVFASYYNTVSYAKVTVQVDVFGWYKLSRPMVYYGRDCNSVDDADCGGSPVSWWIARDSVVKAANDVRFDQYDYFVFLHSGIGEESSRTAKDAVWSVAYLGGIFISTPTVTLTRFNIVPELEASGAVPTGVYIHEFGHLLGLPDLYNTNTGTTVMGPWSLMDKGLWNGNPPGSTPAEMEAWSRIKLGWLNGSQLAIAEEGAVANYTIDALEVQSNTIHAVKVPLTSQQAGSSSKNYYLVEVRQPIGNDAALPSSGVLITLVDERFFQAKVTPINGHPDVPGLADVPWRVGQVLTDERNNIAISINGQVGNSYQITVNRLGPLPDLVVTGISTNPTAASPNQTVTITADIANRGTASASGVPVQIFIDNVPYASKQVTLNAGQTAQVSVTWVAVAGSHIVKVQVDPYDALNELSRANNEATYVLNVGPTVIITVPMNVTFGNATAWVKINGVQYTIQGSKPFQTSVAAGPITIEVEPNIYLSNNTRQSFTAWSDGNNQNPRQITVTNNTALTARYNTQYLLTVDPNGGSVTPSGWFNANSTVTVAAANPSNVTQQSSRMIFVGWTGDLTTAAPSLTLTMNQPYSLKANWKQQYYVTIVSPAGSASGSGWYDAGSVATISVEGAVITGNGTRQVFLGWNDSSQQSTTLTIVVNSPVIYQALWKTQYLVTVQSAYGNPQGSGWYDQNSSVQISIIPQISYQNHTRRVFTGWSGDYTGKATSVTLVADSPKNLMAHWKTQYQVSFKVSGLPNGTDTTLQLDDGLHPISISTPYSAWYDAGHALNPTANQTLSFGFLQFRFAGWQNSTGGFADPPFIVNGPTTYTASYRQDLPLLAVPGFGFESILAGLAVGLSILGLRRRRTG